VIRVLIEVGSTSRFGVTVQAESIRRAVEIVQAHHPGTDARVVYPIDPESFFVKEQGRPRG
jgi:hypothetical protein